MYNQLLSRVELQLLKCFCSIRFLFRTNLHPQNTIQWLSGVGAMMCWPYWLLGGKKKTWLFVFINFCGVNTLTMVHIKLPMWFTEQNAGKRCAQLLFVNLKEPTLACHCKGRKHQFGWLNQMPRDRSGYINEGRGPEEKEVNWRAHSSWSLPYSYDASVTISSNFSRRVRNLVFRWNLLFKSWQKTRTL